MGEEVQFVLTGLFQQTPLVVSSCGQVGAISVTLGGNFPGVLFANQSLLLTNDTQTSAPPAAL